MIARFDLISILRDLIEIGSKYHGHFGLVARTEVQSGDDSHATSAHEESLFLRGICRHLAGIRGEDSSLELSGDKTWPWGGS
jgi:hypothetical protein